MLSTRVESGKSIRSTAELYRMDEKTLRRKINDRVGILVCIAIIRIKLLQPRSQQPALIEKLLLGTRLKVVTLRKIILGMWLMRKNILYSLLFIMPTTQGRKTALSSQQEIELADCIRVMCRYGFSPTVSEILDLVAEYIDLNKLEISYFKNGKTWSGLVS